MNELNLSHEQPTGRADFEVSSTELEVRAPGLRVRSLSKAPARAPGSIASAVLLLALAGCIPAAGIAMLGWYIAAEPTILLIVDAAVFLLTFGSGLGLLISTIRTRKTRNADRHSGDDPGDDPGGDSHHLRIAA
ncbi:hypothetical protein [Saccharopolyspora spinosa]|uniref:Uncharacterized protein n=1 Tax=Saccharopolyspora spinosa TaxID=60894 RepID=A0A2N3Y6P1_SACSN|nr:hypothetical protein [Saccharopolyspora spinosa]PKW18604.1 hypothetical protein A8926_6706 [Saccharopolyspora spinosa]